MLDVAPPTSPIPEASRGRAVWALALGSAAALAAAVLASSCGTHPRRDLTVTSWSPSAPVDHAAPIEVRFDRPVVAAALVGGPVDPEAITVTPAIAWTGHWRDRQTIVLEPGDALRPGTRYEVRLAGSLARRAGGFAFAFVHRPLVIDGLVGDDPGAIAPDGDLSIAFSLPVTAGAVAATCALERGRARVGLRAPIAGVTDRVIRVRPAAPLARGATYQLACDGLVPAGGDAPIARVARLELTVRPPLAVTSVGPSGWDVAADQVAIDVELSAPVTLEAIRAAISAEPAIPALAHGWLDGRRYRAVADLDTETEYTLTIAGLVDVHGQALADEVVHTFRTGDASPRISMERGLYALEASASGYPVWSRNVPELGIECAAIPKAKLVALLTGQLSYDPWGGWDDRSPIDWKALGVAPRTAAIPVAGARNRWQLHPLDLGGTCGATPGARGVYLADVSGDVTDADAARRPWWAPRTHRALVNVTDLGVLLKVGPSSGLVWVTRLGTAEPVAGAKVILYTPAGKQVWVDVTDADGLVRTPGANKLLDTPAGGGDDPIDDDFGEGWDWDSYRSQRLIAVVEHDRDLAVVDGTWANGIQIWNFGVPEERRAGVTQVRAFLQSDRGLYRPGETVHLKGIVREVSATGAPRVPRRRPVAVEVSDARGVTAFSGEVPMTAFGGFTFDLPIGAEAPVGDWYVAATIEGRVFRERFSVEEFRAATFEVKVTGGEARARLGERLDLAVDARYLFGAPVAGAEVAWSVNRRRHDLRFAAFPGYTFEDNGRRIWWWDHDPDRYGDFVSDGAGATDAQGRLGFVVRDPDSSIRAPHDYVITASVTDEADQTLSATRVVTAHQTDVYLGLHTQEYVQAVGAPFGVDVVAVSPAGARVPATATLTLVRRVHDCGWQDVAARSYWRCTTREEPALTREVAIPATGARTERIVPAHPGEYLIRIAGADGRGQPVVASSSVWVIGPGEAWWSGDEASRMTLIASKPSYRPGETARLVAQANLIRPTALVTIERDGILRAEVRRLDRASQGLELTIADGWAPNVFASVAMVSGRHGPADRDRPQFKMGVVELAVDASHKQLAVEVVLDEPRVRPGAPVRGRVVVTRGGKPVRAEVAVSVADEGVLQLVAYRTPDPMRTFYATWGLGVDSATNWNRLARWADPDAGDPDAGGDFGGGDRPARSRFLASAYWAPALVTGADGVATFAFDAPDNLTAYRVMAVAADAGDGFGSGEARLVLDKPLMATPVLPRFAGAGDRLSVGVLVHNRTERAGTAKVVAKADGLALERATQEVAIPAGGSARVRFPATASEQAEATLELAVTMNGEADALRVTLPLRRPRVIDVAAVASDAGTGRAREVALPVAPDALRGESEVVITADRTGLGDLEPSLRYLVEYPYGCLEQTLSRFVPLAKAKDLATSLGLTGLAGTRMDPFLAAGVAKVVRHQAHDGHFSLWPRSDTHPHLTVHAMWGLTEAEKAGLAIPAEALDRGAEALAGWLAGPDALAPGNRGGTAAMAAYVLAVRGRADAGTLARLVERRAQLPRWGQAFLLRALVAARADAATIDEVERALVDAVTVTGGRARIDEAPAADDSYYMHSSARATAIVLGALVDRDPSHPLIAPLVAGLDAMRRGDGRWASTQDNVWALIALSDYARRAASGTGWIEITAPGEGGDARLARKRLRGAEVHAVRVPLASLAADRVTVRGDAGVHWRVRLVQARRDDGAAVAAGFRLRREYLDAGGAPVTTARAGELVTVRLTLTADATREWVALVDPLPAGLEAVNPALATSGGAGLTSADATGHRWRAPSWDHTEVRDDRVLWFADRIHAGSYVMTYKARATIDGAFAAPPATVEAMYEPDVRARTATATFTVTR